jgi:hypothetical protein
MKIKNHRGDLIVLGSWFVIAVILGALLAEIIHILQG